MTQMSFPEEVSDRDLATVAQISPPNNWNHLNKKSPSFACDLCCLLSLKLNHLNGRWTHHTRAERVGSRSCSGHQRRTAWNRKEETWQMTKMCCQSNLRWFLPHMCDQRGAGRFEDSMDRTAGARKPRERHDSKSLIQTKVKCVCWPELVSWKPENSCSNIHSSAA